MEVQQGEAADFFAMMAAKEVNQAMGRSYIGPYGVGATSAIVSQIGTPARRKRASRVTLPF